jgi:hypothetical protein
MPPTFHQLRRNRIVWREDHRPSRSSFRHVPDLEDCHVGLVCLHTPDTNTVAARARRVQCCRVIRAEDERVTVSIRLI